MMYEQYMRITCVVGSSNTICFLNTTRPNVDQIHDNPDAVDYFEEVEVQEAQSPVPNGEEADQTTHSPQLQRQFTLAEARSYKHWLHAIFCLNDEDVQNKCGSDALQYLRFQRHIIFYLSVIVVLSICVILPLNFQGTLQGTKQSFEHTTLVNLDPRSDFLWVHIVFSFLFFPLAIVVMRR